MKTTKRALLSSVLSLFLCFVMLMGTTFAWFTDSVTSANNVIQSGTLDVTFEWVDGSKDPTADDTVWTDASTGAIFDYTNWEPGYAAARHLKVSNVGTLALNYQMRIVANGVVSKLADAIDVYYIAEDAAATRTDIANAEYLGTLTQVLGTKNNLSKTINGSILAGGDADIHTIVLKMNELAGNEYQGMDLGCTFSVELIATQMSAESDSFDNQYDANVPSPELPAALVRPLDDLNISYTTDFPNGTPVENPLPLNAGYIFMPTEYGKDLENPNNPEFPNEAGISEYRHWHADYVVTADKDVVLNTIALAGYYAAFCKDYNNDNWVAIMDDSTDVLTAGTEVPLLANLANGFCVTYQDICDWANDGEGFKCGVIARDAAALAGTTITVQLRLYKNENNVWSDSSHDCDGVNYDGHYEVVGEFKYTFPKTVDGQTELNTEIGKGGTFTLTDGNYTLPAASNTTVAINGTKDTVITVNKPNFSGSDVTLNGVTVKGSGYATGIQHVNTVTYNDATIIGEMCLYGEKVVFNNCTFELNGQYVWTYGAKEVEFNNCTFNTTGKAILVYNEGAGGSTVTVKGCTFNATAGAKAGAIANQNCAAIEIDNFQSSGTGAAHTVITEGNTYDSNFSGEWRIKNFVSGNAITVNGTEYTQIAVDGSLMTIDANKNVTVQ